MSAPAPRGGRCVVAIEQPNYVPWIGYFDLVAQCDVFVWLDTVQYTPRDWRNRNRVGAHEAHWITIPVRSRGRRAQRIADVEIDAARPWARKHLASVASACRGAPHFAQVFALYESYLTRPYRLLADLTIDLNEALCRAIGLDTRFLRASAIAGAPDDRRERLLGLCERTGGTLYLSGPSARDYLAPDDFRRRSLGLRYIRYEYPPYPRGSLPFVERLSILDALCWLGPAGVRAYLREHAAFDDGLAPRPEE